ncbi:hypothetical protein ILUMI_16914, partial [Ignelater luminosus]
EKEEFAKPLSPQTRIKLPTIAQACDRTKVSNRTTAVLVNAVLKDLGVATKKANKVIDRSKIRKERMSLPEISSDEFHADQEYLYELCDGVSKGNVLLDLSKQFWEE